VTIIYLEAENKLDLFIVLKAVPNFDMAYQDFIRHMCSGPVIRKLL